jgi:hypothetical protein
MRHKIFRYTVLAMVAMLMLTTMTGCLFGGDDEPVVEEETPDIDATVSARLTAAAPTEVPPDPEGTVAAMLAAALADQEAQAALDAQATAQAQPPPTNTPEPTDTPVPTIQPTDTPVPTIQPTDTPVPTIQPTDTPIPTPTVDVFTRPAIITGFVRIRGSLAPQGTVIYARSTETNPPTELQTQTDSQGKYSFDVRVPGIVLDLYVGSVNTGVKTAPIVLGDVQARPLAIQ